MHSSEKEVKLPADKRHSPLFVIPKTYFSSCKVLSEMSLDTQQLFVLHQICPGATAKVYKIIRDVPIMV